MKSLNDFDVVNKRILVRCDFNVPLDEKGNILDDFKIKQTLPTIKYLVDKKAKIILMSHLDPESTNVADKKYNLNNVAQRLGDLLNTTIEKEDDCIGVEVEEQSNKLEPGKILLLENLRFHKEETECDAQFAQKLSYLGDIYVNDAFSVCHRLHASVAELPKLLPHAAGLLLEKEITTLEKVMQNPEKPMVALVGGAKVGTKAKFIDNISKVADFVIISGLIKEELIEKEMLFKHQDKIIGPMDNLTAPDISNESIKMFSEKIMQAKTILWNGPFGKFEDAEFAKGTLALANAIIESKAFSVAGGGETVEFLEKQGILNQFSWVSTGGGAMLQFLSGEKLPGIEALGN